MNRKDKRFALLLKLPLYLWTVLFVLLCGAALAMLIWKRREENDSEEIDEENMEDFAE